MKVFVSLVVLALVEAFITSGITSGLGGEFSIKAATINACSSPLSSLKLMLAELVPHRGHELLL